MPPKIKKGSSKRSQKEVNAEEKIETQEVSDHGLSSDSEAEEFDDASPISSVAENTTTQVSIDPNIIGTLIEKIDKLTTSVNTMSKNQEEMRKDINAIKEQKILIGKVEEQAGENKRSISVLSLALKNANAEIASLKTEVIHLDSYVRRDNLIIYNLPTHINENCEKKVKALFKDTLQLEDSDDYKIVRCHRLNSQSEPKPMIVRFHFYGDRQKVWKARSLLAETEISLSEDFHPDVVKKRKTLYPYMKGARSANLNSYLMYDKLVINGTTYTVDTLDSIPDCLKYLQDGYMKLPEIESLAFFGSKSPLSNFHEAPFKENTLAFQTVEHYLTYKKALLFGDDVTAEKIYKTKTPAAVKSLGSKIKNVNVHEWQQNAEKIMKTGLLLKFTSSPECRDFLLNTENLTLAEASPNDKFWGIGVSLSDKKIAKGNWPGKNVLGKLLMEVREELPKS